MEAITLNHEQTVQMCFVLLVAGRTELALNKLHEIGRCADRDAAALAVERIRITELVAQNERLARRINELGGQNAQQARRINELEAAVESLDGQIEEIITGERPQPEKCDGKELQGQEQEGQGQGSR